MKIPSTDGADPEVFYLRFVHDYTFLIKAEVFYINYKLLYIKVKPMSPFLEKILLRERDYRIEETGFSRLLRIICLSLLVIVMFSRAH